ncbi:MAG TPA: GNAT family N-acetyltransferase [Fimbriimonadaceae bacterium]|jgi:GNAT superfamily N-acetyltransferase
MPSDPLYVISNDKSRLDIAKVHSWLTTSYWSPGVSLETVARAAENSALTIGVYLGSEQVGYLRVVSDKTTFAWVADVWVDEPHRGKGLARKMVRAALEDKEHQGLRRWVLATRDAHEIYESCGFVPLPERSRWMVRQPE